MYTYTFGLACQLLLWSFRNDLFTAATVFNMLFCDKMNLKKYCSNWYSKAAAITTLQVILAKYWWGVLLTSSTLTQFDINFYKNCFSAGNTANKYPQDTKRRKRAWKEGGGGGGWSVDGLDGCRRQVCRSYYL